MKKKLLLPVFVAMLIVTIPATTSAQEALIGEVKLFAGNFAPKGWTLCEGQLLPISQNKALYSILGTMYGGDGKSNFALPDLRGRVPVGVGQGSGLSAVKDGQKQGTENVTLTVAQLPSHGHSLENVEEVAIKTSPGNNNTKKLLSPVVTVGSTTVTTKNTGGSQPVSIKQPSLGMRYIICIWGIYPSRN